MNGQRRRKTGGALFAQKRDRQVYVDTGNGRKRKPYMGRGSPGGMRGEYFLLCEHFEII
jgi:hypothetical protein|tara:strand:+ start:212 stop:388 length:177 start_codon:yes stop_codon:yes gene_type:complete